PAAPRPRTSRRPAAPRARRLLRGAGTPWPRWRGSRGAAGPDRAPTAPKRRGRGHPRLPGGGRPLRSGSRAAPATARPPAAALCQCITTPIHCQAHGDAGNVRTMEQEAGIAAPEAPPTLEVPTALASVLAAIRDAGGRPFVVGGAVRDAFLGLPLKDFDVEV